MSDIVQQVALRAVLPNTYGHVVAVAAAGIAVDAYLRLNVFKARQVHGVYEPIMYSPENNLFNCIQRAQQEYAEFTTPFLCSLLISGLHTPKVSALLGVAYLTGRILSSHGFYSGEPSKRVPGAMISGGALAALTANTMYFAAHHSGVLLYLKGLLLTVVGRKAAD